MTRDELRTELERILVIYGNTDYHNREPRAEDVALDAMMCAIDEHNRAEAIAWM